MKRQKGKVNLGRMTIRVHLELSWWGAIKLRLAGYSSEQLFDKLKDKIGMTTSED